MRIRKIDLHMHSTVSDGTDTPEEILTKVKAAGIDLFALSDHDAIKGFGMIRAALKPGDPRLLSGAEFSCRDEEGKYHILGYGYDPDALPIQHLVETGHSYRVTKVTARLSFLEQEYGFIFPEVEVQALMALDNPGKPHIGNLMVKYGYAETKEDAIRNYINKMHTPSQYLRPEEAIRGILEGGGIPVLAHPAYGSGEERILGADMDHRLRRLIAYGLRGVEAFYSGFPPRLRAETLAFALKYKLLVTAGSDYHGRNKLITLGDTGLQHLPAFPPALERFLKEVEDRII